MKNSLGNVLLFNLKEDILLNRLHPGDAVSELELCEKYHISRTPVRQALQRLESLGLVEIRDGVGTFVTYITEQQMRDAYQIRCLAEILAIQTAIDNIPEKDLLRLEERFRKYKEQLSKGGGYGASFEEMVKTDWELHDTIIRYSENKMLSDSIEKITLVLRRYQMAYVTLYDRATEEHIELVTAIKIKNRGMVEAVLRKHLQFRTF